MKRCPYCAEEIQDEAIKCRHCGSSLTATVTGLAGDVVQFTHSGQRYLLGYTAQSYGIWDRAAGGPPARRYAKTDEGWRAAWHHFAALEPRAVDVRLPDPATTPVYAAQTNGYAIASLVLGILWLWGIGSILALIFGYVGKNQIDESLGRQTGRGMAVAGIVLGWIGVGLLVLFIAAVASNSSSSS